MIAPALEEISEEMGAVDIVKVNIDENPDLAAQFGVRSIPTLMLFKNGEQASVQVGAAPSPSSSPGSIPTSRPDSPGPKRQKPARCAGFFMSEPHDQRGARPLSRRTSPAR